MSQKDTDGTQYDEFLTEELNRMRAAGGGVQKIQMIKRLREKSGLGLKEAKDAVEAFGARHCPELKAAGTGCLIPVIAALLMALVLWVGSLIER